MVNISCFILLNCASSIGTSFLHKKIMLFPVVTSLSIFKSLSAKLNIVESIRQD